MKNKNISFAQVLRKKGRTSQVEMQKGSLKLGEMVQQWEVYPDQDYTLRLGDVGLSQRSNTSAVHMFSSKNASKEQELMFDSWIQRQSFITNNKENIGIQPRKVNRNVTPTAAVKLTLNPRGRDYSKNKGRTMAQMIRQTQTTQVQYDEQQEQPSSSNPNFQYNTHIQQKFYTKQSKREAVRSPKGYTAQKEDLNLQIEEVLMQIPKEQDKQSSNQQSRNSYNQCNKPKTQNNALPQSEDILQNQLQQILNSTENIHQQIAELAHKYYSESHSNHTEEDEELLIDQSVQKAPLQQPKKEQKFEEDYSATAANISQEEQKRRLEEAKNTLNGYLKNLNKTKLNSNNNLTLSPKNSNNPEYRKAESNSIPAYLQVGYSFASNVNDTRKQQAESIEHSEKTTPLPPQQQSKQPKLEQSDDLNFRNKYINTEVPVVSEEHIQNIESIRYEHETERNGFAEQAIAQDNVPNLSFEVKLINSNGRKNETRQQYTFTFNQQSQNRQQRVQTLPQIYVSIPNAYEYSDNSYRNGLKKDEYKHQIEYQEFRDRPAEGETAFAKKQTYTNYHLHDFRDRLHIKSPKTVAEIASNSKNSQQTNNFEYISKPFEINIETAKVDNQLTLGAQNIYEKAESPKIVQQTSTKKVQQQPISAPFKPKQLQSVCSPACQSKNEPVYQIQSPSYMSSLNPTAYNPSTFNPASYTTSNFKYKPSATYLPTSTYSTCTPSYSNTPTYEPSKITFISPKAYEKPSDTPSYAKFISTFQLPKTQYTPAPAPIKIQTPSSLPREQKYSVATPYQPKTDKTDRVEKKNFLSQLTIKQSITVEQEKPRKIIPLISKTVKSSINKTEGQAPLRQSIRLAAKESVKLQNSDEFQFQF